jgi:chemosensory pili system protein ChpA (sensor histidine kinase/response regulator)
MKRPDTDNLFGDDLADLLESFEDSEPSPKEDTNLGEGLDDLIDLFDENFPDSNEKIAPERITLSSLPSEAEIRDIFNEDIFGDNENESQSQLYKRNNFPEQDQDNWFNQSILPEKRKNHELLNSSELDQELIELFGDDVDNTDDTSDLLDYSKTLSYDKTPVMLADEANASWDELEELLANSATSEPTITPHLQIHSESAINDNFPSFYEPFEALDSLLEEPASLLLREQKGVGIFLELEAIIEAEGTKELISVPTVLDDFETPLDQETDDEFGDLEQLLAATNQSLSGQAGVTAAPGQRLQPRRTSTKMVEQTMRVPIKHLDNLSNLIGELVVKRNRLEQDQERLRLFLDNLLNQVQNLSDVGGRMQDLYERTLLEGALLASRNRAHQEVDFHAGLLKSEPIAATPSAIEHDLDALEMDRFTDFHLLSQEMIELIVRVRESASDIQFVVDETDQVARNLRQVTTQLQEGMTKSRMIPFAQTADRLPRAIREISLKLNKQVKLHVEGKDVLIDKMIQEHLYSPMTHLANNAITHGIETPEERIKKGKPKEGQILLRTFLQGNQTVISVSDDGAGIDPERVKQKAIEKGLITQEEALALTNQEVYDFLFHPGFSTKDKADDFSGRGVGLDVVRTSLTEVRGSVNIDSTIGKGTTFTIRLPLTLSISKALCCLSNYARIAFPMDGVEDMKDFSPSEIQINEAGEKCIPWFDVLLPFQSLHDLLYYNRQLSRGNIYGGKQEEEIVSIVILRSGQNYLALQVDRVLGEQEIVIKQIEGPIPKPPGVGGATVLGDGTIMPIADVLELIEIAQGKMRADGTGSPWRLNTVPLQPVTNEKTEPTVLIVDDSITVRELLSLSFSKAGYRVEQARDGQEAWEKLRSGMPCDIVFCDIEMPRMNGLELLSNIQKDDNICNLPVALLTSRGAERHRNVASKLGASGYFTKPYTEKDLLDAAKRMINGEVLLADSNKVPRKPKGENMTDISRATPSKITIPPAQVAGKASNIVLIIDDSVMVREMLSMTFNKAGYEIEKARDGQEAWEKLQEGLACDLILCDIEMPRMNGLELLSRLQEDEKLSMIPVAMITSRGAQKMQNIAAERGAKGYFVKPYIEEVLIDAAKRLIAGEVLLEKGSKVER